MDEIKDRLSNLENVISNLVSSMKKIEDVQSKKDLYSFSTKQLIKWLNDNEVEYQEDIRDRLVDIVWKNLNEWEWEYYYEDEDEEESEEDLPKNKKKNKVVESSDSEESEEEDDDDDNFGGAKTKNKVART